MLYSLITPVISILIPLLRTPNMKVAKEMCSLKEVSEDLKR
jgi:hypothetical protein